MCTSSCFALNHFFHLHYGALIAEVVADIPLEMRRKAFFTSLVRCVGGDIPLRGDALYDELVTCSFPVRPTIPGSYLHGNARKSDNFAVDARTMSSSAPKVPFDMSKLRLNQVDLARSCINLSMFRTTPVFPKQILVTQLFDGSDLAYNDWMSNQCIELEKFRNIFAWYKVPVDEISVFQPLYQLFGERLLGSLNMGFSIVNDNGTNLIVDCVLKDGTNVDSNGSTDLLVSDTANSKQSFIELKTPFSKSKGMYRTACAKPRDQLVLQVHSKFQTSAVPSATGADAHIGLLTDLFCSAVDICIGGHHHLSQRVETAVDCIQLLLLLCCSVKEGDIPVKEEDPGPDAYLTSTREEPDDASDSDQGGESLPPAKKTRCDPSSKPATRLRSHSLRSAGAHGKQVNAGTKSVFDFKAEDRQDEYAEKIARMQAVDAFRGGYASLTEENLENHNNMLPNKVRNDSFLF